MSQFLAEIKIDPKHVILKPAQKLDAEGRGDGPDLSVKVQEQLKPKLNFDLKTLAQSGQLALLQVSEKYGAMLFAYGPELIVVPNAQLNQFLEERLPVEELLAKGKN